MMKEKREERKEKKILIITCGFLTTRNLLIFLLSFFILLFSFACDNPMMIRLTDHMIEEEPPVPPPPPVLFTIILDPIGLTGSNAIDIDISEGYVGDTVTISYTLDNADIINQLTLSFGTATPQIKITSAGSLTHLYTINAGDAVNGVITITAVFFHSDKFSLDEPTNVSLDQNGKIEFTPGANNSAVGGVTYTFTLYRGATPVVAYTDVNIENGGETISALRTEMLSAADVYRVKIKAINSTNPDYVTDNESGFSNSIFVYSVTVTMTGNTGTDKVTVNGDDYNGPVRFFSGTFVTLKLIPDTGRYGYWSGNNLGSIASDILLFTLTENATATANFTNLEPLDAPTAVTLNQSGAISFTPGTNNPSGTTYTYTLYKDGTAVAAYANQSIVSVGTTISALSTEMLKASGAYTVRITATTTDASYLPQTATSTASAAVNVYSVAVTMTGVVSGDSITVGSTNYTATFTTYAFAGSNVELTATPGTNRYVTWSSYSASGSVTGDTLTITGIAANETATATFAAPEISITAQPYSIIVEESNITGSLSVTASVTPTGTPTYQWYSNTTNSNTGGTAISGETSASFTIPTTHTEGIYYYFCEVSMAGVTAINSDVGTLIVTAQNNVTGPVTVSVDTITYNNSNLQSAINSINAIELSKNFEYDKGEYIITVYSSQILAGRTTSTFGSVSNLDITLKGYNSNIDIELDSSTTGNLFRISNNQIMTIENIRLKGHGNNNNSLVYISSSTFKMNNGSFISDNTNSSSGGGVYVLGTSSFIMSDNSSVLDNTGYFGGGVMVNGTNSHFTMKDNSSVSNNTATYSGGGVYISSGILNMIDNSSVSNNTATYSGGGVYITSNGNFTMNDNSSVTENKDITTGNGGGVYISSGIFTMNNNSSISYNYTTGSGGGVNISGGTFIMNDNSSVLGNEAVSGGGGVFVNAWSGNFKKNFGAIITGYEDDTTNSNKSSYGHAAIVNLFPSSPLRNDTVVATEELGWDSSTSTGTGNWD